MLISVMKLTSKPENHIIHFISFPKLLWFPTFNIPGNDREPSTNIYKIDILQRLVKPAGEASSTTALGLPSPFTQ